MPPDGMGRDRDLVLAPGEYAFVLDTTKGLVNVIVGPNKTSMSNTDQPVTWVDRRKRFDRCTQEDAVQSYPNAPEGYYIVLANPVESGKEEHPREGTSTVSVPLKFGRKVNIPGPTHFALWPGQTAQVIEGHHLRSNQYLIVRVYNDEEARNNWSNAVVKPQPQTPKQGPSGEPDAQQSDASAQPPSAPPTPPQNFTMGQLMVIKGTDVAFFIPPTGVEVIPEDGQYVRSAVTLERLEYCILLDESGNKRYVQGPAVVFPRPTENFVTKGDARKFKAVELNENSGIYVKVIAEYSEGERTFKVGEELFITGRDQAIYFPREEHSIIKYGDQVVHYAVAVPAGEGRYVLDRNKGEVRLVKGPTMLLPDPRKEVLVRRFLAEKTAALWYPGNEKVVQVNRELEALSKKLPPGDFIETGLSRRGISAPTSYQSSGLEDALVTDSFNRSTSYTPPRTVTLDTKYDGAITVNVWTGYAVLVVNKTGNRRVVMGPQTILLEYDETLAPMELSTGTPKTDDQLFKTVYLKVLNNKVSDVVRVETKDLVQVKVSLSYRVNFEGEKHEKWFAVENYVRLLVDHMRSLIRNAAKSKGIEEFYGGAISIVRDAILGTSTDQSRRPGRAFDENGMRVYDVEVLDVQISDPQVRDLLGAAQSEVITASLQVSKEERSLEVAKKTEEVRRKIAEEKSVTERTSIALDKQNAQARHESTMAQLTASGTEAVEVLRAKLTEQQSLNDLNQAQLDREKAVSAQQVELKRAELQVKIDEIKAETEEIVKRAGAVNSQLALALTTFSDQALVEKMIETLAPMAAMSGVSAAEVLAQLFKGTPFEDGLKALGTRTRMTAPVTTK